MQMNALAKISEPKETKCGWLAIAACLVLAVICRAEAANVSSAGKASTTPESPAQYANPIIGGAADPDVIRYEGLFYAYVSGYRVYSSKDLVHWTPGPKIFKGRTGLWAPDVYFNPTDKTFYLYYSCDNPDTSSNNAPKKLIGVATSSTPDGNFVDQGILTSGIDPHLFADEDGSFYLFTKASATANPETSNDGIFVNKMTDLTHLGPTTTCYDTPSKEPIAEAPFVLKHNGIYYLLYSYNGAKGPNYAVGYATSSDPVGPFTPYSGNPIVSRDAQVFGPGHGSVIVDDAGKLWHVYHQKDEEAYGWERSVCIDPIWFDEQGVLHSQATRNTMQDAPTIKVPTAE